jgi:hypothetical protein
MAKVIGVVLGGSPKEYTADTVQELHDAMGLKNHSATIQGEEVDMDYELEGDEIVRFTENTKGA